MSWRGMQHKDYLSLILLSIAWGYLCQASNRKMLLAFPLLSRLKILAYKLRVISVCVCVCVSNYIYTYTVCVCALLYVHMKFILTKQFNCGRNT